MSSNTMAGLGWIGAVFAVLASLAVVLIFDVDLDFADAGRTLLRIHANAAAHFVELGLDVLSYLLAGLAGVATAMLMLADRPVAAVLIGLLFAIGAGIGVNHDAANFSLAWIGGENEPAAADVATAQGLILQAKWGVSLSALATLLGTLALCGAALAAAPQAAWFWWAGAASAVLALASIPLSWAGPGLMQTAYALYLPVLAWQLGLGIRLLTAAVPQ